MNTKIAIATSIMAATVAMTSTAEAGVRIGFGFPIGAFVAHRHMEAQEYEARRYRAQQRAERAEIARLKRQQAIEAAKVRKAKAEAIAAAKAEKAAAAKAKAVAEAKARTKAEEANKTVVATATSDAPAATSTGSTANVKTAANTAAGADSSPKPENVVTKLECKRYFANVGLTISVPCED